MRTTHKRKWFSQARKKVRTTRPWETRAYPSGRQEFVPREKGIAKKIGLKRREKVLFFAGCFGDWASAIADTCEVKYTDISTSMMNSAKNKGKIKSFRIDNAILAPRRKKVYDWSVSFEPYPVAMTRGINMTLVRSLLNNKGLVMVFSPKKIRGSPLRKFFKDRAKRIAELYGAKFEEENLIIHGEGKEGIENRQSYLLRIRTNSQAREKAHLDVRVLMFLEKRGTLTTSKLAQLTKTSTIKVEESLKRINALGRLKSIMETH